jgi:hypothetical protein
MKKIVIFFVVSVFLLTGNIVFAAKGGNGRGPHPNASAYEHANENARFKRAEGWQGGDATKKEKAKKKHKKNKSKKDKDNSQGDATAPVTTNGATQ